MKRLLLLVSLALCAPCVMAIEDDYAQDVRDDPGELPFKYQRGDFVAVPIPMSDPTLGTGLILASAYFYGQSEQQKATQPASVTGLGAMFTDNSSEVYILGHSHYWGEDRWRFTGATGYADLNLTLLSGTEEARLDWNLEGSFLQAKLSREFSDQWYVNASTRFIQFDQQLSLEATNPALLPSTSTSGVGFGVEYDTRDLPMNSFTGQYLQVDALVNSKKLGGKYSYESYSARYRTFHTVLPKVVLGIDTQVCLRDGDAPLWDYCRIPLRGFSAVDYLGRTSGMGQVEARWHLSPRWGLTSFAGVGTIDKSYDGLRNNDLVGSYGIGFRYMVLKSKRINIRVDLAKSGNSEAIHLSVGEAF